MKIFHFLIILILINVPIWAQNPYTLKITENDNLPSNEIYDLIQDKKGFIWISSTKGLSKYNGVSFKNFNSTEQTSLAGSSIVEDIYGRIWYENFDGFLYFVENNKLKSLKQNKPLGFFPYGITDNFLFVLQKNGIDIYDLKNLKVFKTVTFDFDVPEHATVYNNDFYFITDDILYKLNSEFILSKSTFFQNKKLHVKYIYPYKDGIYVLSKLNETQQIYFFDKDLNFKESFEIPNISIVQGSKIIDDNLWIHTSKGSYIFNLIDKKIVTQPYFEELSISNIIKDNINQFWFSTVSNGIRIVPNLKNQFLKLSKSALKTITKVNNYFYVGTVSGEIIESSLVENDSKILFKAKENLPTYYLYSDSISKNIFFSIKGFNIAVKSNFSDVLNYDIALKDVVRINDSFYAFASSNFVGLIKNPSAQSVNPSNWNTFFHQNLKPRFNQIAVVLNNVRSKSICFNAENQSLFFSTNVGTFRFKDNVLTEIFDSGKSFYSSKVFQIKKHTFTLGTKGNLYEIDKDLQLISLNNLLNIAEGAIQSIKIFDNKMYLVLENGLYVYDQIQIKKIEIPIQIHFVNDFYVDKQQLVLLVDEGIIKLNLKEQRASLLNNFRIDDLLVNNENYNWKTNHIFTIKQNNIKINFSLLEYVNKNISVYYRINSDRWILLNKDVRYLDFPSLAVGNYCIEFKIDEQIFPEKIQFEIVLPFWKKWWFYVIISSFVLSIGYLYFRWLSSNLKQKMKLHNDKIKLEKDLSKSVLTSIKSQMNPHFFYNALNTIQAYIFINDKQKANMYLAKFSKLTRMILEMSEKETVSLQEEIQSINLYLELEQLRFNDDFRYEIIVSDTVANDLIEFPPMLLQPYIENAIKHGLLHSKKEKFIGIVFEKQLNDLKVIIEDNGIGRKRASAINNQKFRKHQSFATNANEKRLEILNNGKSEKISVQYIDKYENEIATGTKVILTIPLN